MYENVLIRFTILKLALLLSSFIAGYFMSHSKNSKQYWKGAFIIIATFAVVEGMRFGRLIDWNNYYIRYQEIGSGISEENYELLFTTICRFLYMVGIPYWGFITLQCGFLMYSCCLLFQEYKKCAFWILPPVIYLLLENENFIRWYLAASFLFISLYNVQKNKKTRVIAFFSAAVLCHSGMIIFSLLFLLNKFSSKHLIEKKIAASLFIIFTFFISIHQMHFIISIAAILSKIGLGNIDHVGGYLKTANLLINGKGASDIGFFYRSFTNQIRLVIEYLPIILLAPHFIKQYKLGPFFYNLFILGAILDPVFSMVEILGRFSSIMLFSASIVGGIVYYHTIILKQAPKYIRHICLISFFCGIWPSISIVFANYTLYDIMFIWDSGYMDYIPTINLQ